jgi:Tim44-like domain
MGGRDRIKNVGLPLRSSMLSGLLIAIIFFLILPVVVMARAGGGEGYGGGGGGGNGSGGGGDGGAIYLVYMLVRLCIVYPVVGVPVVIVIGVVLIAGSRQGTNVYQSSVIRRGSDVIDQQSKNSVIASIRQHDPQFDEGAFCKRVSEAFAKVQQAWMAQNLNTVRPFISDGVHERFSLQFAEQRDAGYRDVLQGLSIGDIQLADIFSAGVFDEVAVRIEAQAADYRVAISDGHHISGSTSVEPFVEVWSFLRKRGAVTDLSRPGLMEGNCPNCGASIEMNESANCANCKALLRSGQYDWVLSEITQESEWSASSNRQISGLELLRKQDSGFDPLALEDRASVVFWRCAAADRTGKVDPLRKIAADEFLNKYAQTLRPPNGQPRMYIGDCAIGGLHMLGFIPSSNNTPFERALVEIHWSGTQFAVQPDGRVNRGGSHVLAHSLMVLGRKAGSQTDAGKSISSAHCPNCGAPVSSDTSNACEFCNTVLNDLSRGWVLLDMPRFGSPSAQALVGATQLGNVPATAPPPTTRTTYSGSDAGLLAWAVAVAAADHNVDDNERCILATFATQCGVSSEQLNRMIAAAINGQIEVPQPTDRNQAEAWLLAMATTAQADGNITPDGFSLLKTLGDKVGLSDYDIKMLIKRSRMEQYTAASAALRTAKNSN